MKYLEEHPYYQIYRKELDIIYQYASFAHKEDLSPEAQEVWDYKEELKANGLHSGFIRPLHYIGNPYSHNSHITEED